MTTHPQPPAGETLTGATDGPAQCWTGLAKRWEEDSMRCPNDEIAEFLEDYAYTRITADDAAAAMAAIDWQGYYPVVDEDLDLTGDWRYADAEEPDYYLVQSVDAAIERSVAEANGWVIDAENGTAEPQPSTPMPWPGPTRLYDPDVGCGAVLLTLEQAHSVALAIGAAIRSGEFEEEKTRQMVLAMSIIDHTFRLNIGIDPLPAGTDVTWCGEPWMVVEWQPHNGIGGCYQLVNAAGQSATASPDEIK